ncbi:hypothetical protein CIPAW_05G263800 [Carya illinoinensis]|uniref:mitogen-activated protein kinase kinase kinase n=1 Tax=Carya illinoinensis TaxID=32201 RepID=A0A8T1QQ38_CARIL|nr:hypothetical protein CIPAW_05G263800 [Carya illinoinensis]
MPSWWGKSSSKEAKKKTSKESFIDTLHKKFKSSSEGKPSNRSGGSQRHRSDTVSEKGSRSPLESRSPSPSKHVARCQSFAERAHAHPLPLPGVHSACIGRTDSGISISIKPRLEEASKPSLLLPLPRPGCIHGRPNPVDLDGDVVNASVFSESSVDSDDLADSHHRSPQATDCDTGTRGSAGSPSSLKHKDQSSNVAQMNSREGKKPPNRPFMLLTAPCQVLPEVQLELLAVIKIFWQQSRGSPEYSPVRSPRMTSPGPSSRIHSGAVTPTHPRAGGTSTDSQMSWPDDAKQKSHRLPLPPITISNTSPFSHSNSAATSPSVPRSPGRAENPASPGSRWKKGKLLGRGTFGHVYVGFNSESGEMCAMKEVTLFSDDAKSKESAKQLMQEIALLSRLRHPNIVQYYGTETVGDKLYIYLEYVSGGSIFKLLQDYGQFGELAIRSYTHQILSGLAYLHAKNTVHRDIKGANILVDPVGRVKLADFGMAKHIAGQSCPLSFKGSPYWMAPEVIKTSNGCNLAVDIWSLGCTVLEMATTKPPWSQYEGVAAMFKIGNSKELPAIPEHLSRDGKDFVWQCLQRNPIDRPKAAELLEHPFVKYVAPLERPILSPDPSSPPAGVTNGVKALGIGQARNLSTLDSDRLAFHSSRVPKTGSRVSEIHIPRNISCPVSPIGSPLLHSRSPHHLNERMSPSPISSPRTTSGSSTPLTGGGSGIPFNQLKQSVYLPEDFGSMQKPPNGFCITVPSYHESNPDIFKGMQTEPYIFSELVPSENGVLGKQFGRPAHGELYDGQSVLADRVSRQLLSPSSPLSSRTNGI